MCEMVSGCLIACMLFMYGCRSFWQIVKNRFMLRWHDILIVDFTLVCLYYLHIYVNMCVFFIIISLHMLCLNAESIMIMCIEIRLLRWTQFFPTWLAISSAYILFFHINPAWSFLILLLCVCVCVSVVVLLVLKLQVTCQLLLKLELVHMKAHN